MIYLGRNVKMLYKQRGLTQEEFAKILGISPGKLSSYITGRVKPQVDLAQDIAAYFDVSIDDLVNKDLTQTSSMKDSTTTNPDIDAKFSYIEERLKALENNPNKTGQDLLNDLERIARQFPQVADKINAILEKYR